MRCAHLAGVRASIRLRLGLVCGCMIVLLAGSPAPAQVRILYGDRPVGNKGVQDVKLAQGKIADENKERIVVQVGAAKQNIPSMNVVEVYYQLPANKTKAAGIYKKAEDTVQLAAQTLQPAKRKEILDQAIQQFQSLQPEVQDLKTISRHVQFKIASISAQRAAGDKDLTLKAIDLLEKFQQDNPDAWQTHYAANLLSQLKGK